MPTVSVIIPTFNRAAMLREAIQSVLDQTYSDYEIIVVDDGSTDNTGEIATELSKLSANLRYVCQAHQGRSAARNHGIGLAQGRYIAFLDSDDRFLPRKLAIQVRCLDDQPEYGMVYSRVVGIDEKGKTVPGSFLSKRGLSGRIYPEMLFIRGTVITTPSTMVRSRILSEVSGFDEAMQVCEDLDLWRRIAKRYMVQEIKEPLSVVRYRKSEKVPLAQWVEARTMYYNKAIAEDPCLEKSMRPRLFSEMFFYYGRRALWQKDMQLAVRLLGASVQTSPFRFPLYLASSGYEALQALRFGCGSILGPHRDCI